MGEIITALILIILVYGIMYFGAVIWEWIIDIIKNQFRD
tara:strand:+ start:895 stop:1011 length:117 start_codon:yes stop_codon:yes gene_type:complete